MSLILFFVGTFILVYLVYQLFVIRKENALKKMDNSRELKLLVHLGKIEIDKVDKKKLIQNLALGNSFIVAFMAMIVGFLQSFINNFYLWIIISLILALILLIPLIIMTYKLIGKIMMKEKKNV